jgi:hypothetical protein
VEGEGAKCSEIIVYKYSTMAFDMILTSAEFQKLERFNLTSNNIFIRTTKL